MGGGLDAGTRATLVYALLIAAALVLLWVHPIDHDPGPAPGTRYPRWDHWSTWHLIGSAILCAGAILLGVPWPCALLLTVGAGVGWEVVNGYVDPWDIFWDAIGALVGLLAAWLARGL
jgi:hypothetical protein